MKIFARWLINTCGILFAAYLIRGISVESFTTAFIAAGVLGVINILIRPIIILLTLPLNILTLGLFTFVINGLIFYFIGNAVKGMIVSDFPAAFLGALMVTVVNAIAHFLIMATAVEESGRSK